MAVVQTTPREYQPFHCTILSFLTYGRIFRPGLFPLRMLYISRMFSLTTVLSHESYPVRLVYSLRLFRTVVPHEFVSFTNGCLNAFHCECSFLCECVFLCENVPFRNVIYSAKMFPFVMQSTLRKCALANGLFYGS